MKKLIFLAITILIVFTVWFCKSPHVAISNKDVSFVYNPVNSLLHPEFIVYHNADTSSILFLKLRLFELLYKTNELTSKNQANVKIFYRLLPSIDSKEIIDSATTVLKLIKNNNSYLTSYITFNAKLDKNYVLDILTIDLNRNTQQQTIIDINKKDLSSKQFFLFSDANSHKPMFHNFINDSITFKISNHLCPNNKIIVSHYNQSFKPSPPPFSSKFEKIELESPVNSQTLSIDKTVKFSITKPGLYSFKHFETDSIQTSIFYFDDFFPEFRTAEKLLDPIQYLTSSKEFRLLNKIPNPKVAVDSFWLENTGSVERAKELIRIYYNRAQLANYYFTSFKEGWKTDRGMIYLVLGMPTTIFKSDNSETWAYGKRAHSRAMEFTFTKKYNPFCENNYVLSRSELYDQLWYQAVDTWRNGRAFSVMN